MITGLPEYTPTWEGPADPLRSKYPLQMIGHHYKQRTHSTYGNVAWTKEAAPQEVWINPIDAQARGIQHGDKVRVFNDRGVTVLPAKVTPRIMPGVVSMPQGAWYKPDAKGVDQGGSANTLTAVPALAAGQGQPAAHQPGAGREGVEEDMTDMAKQLAFHVDLTACIGCKACQIACKDKNDLGPDGCSGVWLK